MSVLLRQALKPRPLHGDPDSHGQYPAVALLFMVHGHAGTQQISMLGPRRSETPVGHIVVYFRILNALSIGMIVKATLTNMVSSVQYILPPVGEIIYYVNPSSKHCCLRA